MFELYVFHRDIKTNQACLKGGVTGVVIDLETIEKAERQKGLDTEINRHTIDDLKRIKQDLGANVICRINQTNSATEQEIDAVLSAGADEILVPMLRETGEAERVMQAVGSSCRVSIMIETIEATRIVEELDQLPVARFYLGLHDLALSRGSRSIFAALHDGTVEAVRQRITNAPFGFAGLTLPDRGTPLAAQHLINEMARLDCGFSVLRRSFFRDTKGRSLEVEIKRIKKAMETAQQRSPQTVQEDSLRCQKDLARIV